MSSPAKTLFGDIAEAKDSSRLGSAFRLRLGPRLTSVFWGFWALLAVVLSWQAYRAHLAHFRPQTIILLALSITFAIIVLHILLKRPLVRGVALPLLAGSTLVPILILEPWALIVTLGLFLAAYGLGRFIRERIGLVLSPGSAEIALSACLGLAVWSWALFWLGLAHLYRAPVFLALLLLVCVVLRREIGALGASCLRLYSTFGSILERNDPLVSVAAVFGGLQCVLGMIVLLTPCLDADFLAFHLPIVRSFAQQQALLPLTTLSYSFYPQGVEVLMTFGYVLGGAPASQLIPPVFFVLLLLLLPSLSAELELPRSTAALGIVFVFTLPFLHRTAFFGKNDLALSAFQLAALLCYFRFRKDPRTEWLRLGTIFLAASFAVKHVAVFGAIPIGALYLFALWRHSRPFREAAILAALFAAVALPWHVHTYMLTGNPVFPNSIDQAMQVIGTGANAPAGRAKIGYLRPLPLVLYKGKYFFESPSNNPVGILFVALLGAWLVVRRRSRSAVEWIFFLFILLYYLYWAAIWPVVRYAIVPITIFAVMTAGRLAAVQERGSPFSRFLALSVWCCGLFFALLVTLMLEVRPGQVEYLAGRMSRSQYLEVNDRKFASLEFLVRNAHSDDLVYSVRNCAAGFAPNPARFRCDPRFNSARVKARLVEALREEPYRYLVFPSPPWGREWLSELTTTFNLERVHEDEAYTVYRIGPER